MERNDIKRTNGNLNKVISLVICFLILFSQMPVKIYGADDFWDGTTMEIPPTDDQGVFLIENGSQLAWFAHEVNSGKTNINGKLVKNIKLNNGATYQNNWIPIGSDAYPYKGTFDGDGHDIFYIFSRISDDQNDAVNGKYGGLFGMVDGGTIKNLRLALGKFEHRIPLDSSASLYKEFENSCGCFVGFLKSGIVINCENFNTRILSYENSYQKNLGGIVGISQGRIINCVNNGGYIKTNGSGGHHNAGGIVGKMYSADALTSNCINRATLVGYTCCGGIVGKIVKGGEVNNCVNYGEIKGLEKSGGIVGAAEKIGVDAAGEPKEIMISDVYNLGNVNFYKSAKTGGIIGFMGTDYSHYYYMMEPLKPCYPTVRNAYSFLTSTEKGGGSNGAIVGYWSEGSLENVFAQIGHKQFRLWGSKEATKVQDLNGTSRFYSAEDFINPKKLTKLGTQFTWPKEGLHKENEGKPILKFQNIVGIDKDFTKQISEAMLMLNSLLNEENKQKYGTQYVYVIEAVNEAMNRLGELSWREPQKVGEIIEETREKIENIKPGVVIDNELAKAKDNGKTTLNEYIDDLREKHPDLTDEQIKILQAVLQDYSDEIEKCKTVEDVKLKVRDGKDELNTHIAVWEEDVKIIELKERLKKTLETYNSENELSEMWQKKIDKIKVDGVAEILKGKSAEEVRTAYEKSIAAIDDVIRTANSLPAWNGQAKEPAQNSDGIYEIKNGEELAWIAKTVNGGNIEISAKLVNDINLDNRTWTPIGVDKGFGGKFSGDGHTIYGLNVKASYENAGLFGILNGHALVENLTIKGKVEGNRSVTYAGGLAGRTDGKSKSERVTVNNVKTDVGVSVKDVVNEHSAIGGLAGAATNTIFNECQSNGTVEFIGEGKGGIKYFAGGLAGSISSNVSILSSCNLGKVKSFYNAGGVAGQISGTNNFIKGNYNDGNVEAKIFAGGIAGNITSSSSGSEVKSCYSSGAVNLGISGRYIGALFGGSSSADMDEVYALKRQDQPNLALVGVSSDHSALGEFAKESEMKSAEMLNNLNAHGQLFIPDYLNQQHGYPILIWQLPLIDFKTGAEKEINRIANPDNYTTENWKLVEEEIEKAISAIEAAISVDAVNKAYNDGKVAILAIETKASTEVKQLEGAKIDAIHELENYTNPEDYSEINKNIINDILAAAKLHITDCESLDEVQRHLKEAKENLDNVLTEIQEDNKKDVEAAEQVDAYIDDIGEVVFSAYCKNNINIARTAYDKLTDEQKKLVVGYEALETAEKKYDELVKNEELLEADSKIAAEVDSLIEAIGQVNEGSETAIQKARNAFDGLSESQRALVNNSSLLKDAEDAFDLIVARKAGASISAIGEVDSSKKDLIEEAEKAYSALTDKQKKLVSNYYLLETAIKKLAASGKAEGVAKLIDAIGEVGLDSKSAIMVATEAYNGLNGFEQQMVGNFDKLKQAAIKYDSLSKVNNLINDIEKIGIVNSGSGEFIAELRARFDELSETEKNNIVNKSVLFAAEKAFFALNTVNASNEVNPATDAQLSATAGAVDLNQSEVKSILSEYDDDVDSDGLTFEEVIEDDDDGEVTSMGILETIKRDKRKFRRITILTGVTAALVLLLLISYFGYRKSKKKRTLRSVDL